MNAKSIVESGLYNVKVGRASCPPSVSTRSCRCRARCPAYLWDRVIRAGFALPRKAQVAAATAPTGNRGVSYVMVLFTVAVLGTMSLSFILMTGLQRDIASNYADRAQAHYLARAGLNKAIWRVLNEPTFVEENDGEPISGTFHGMPVEYMVDKAENNESILVTSTGSVANATSTLKHLIIPALAGATDPSLLGWWKLDDGAGLTAADSSGNDNHGTLTNMAGNEWTTGQIDGGLEFDGNNDYVDTPIVNNEITNLTFAAWFKSDDAGSIGDNYLAQRFVSQSRDSTYSRLAIGINNNRIATYWHDGGHNVGEGTTTLTSGMWYHAALTYDGSTIRIYLNGNEENSFDESSMTAPSASTTLKIARQISGERSFDGVLDDVRVYGRALSPEEIAELASRVIYHEFTEAKLPDNGQDITLSIPPGTSEGDLLIAAVVTDDDETISPPAGEGWSEIDQDVGYWSVTLGVWWKLADASESPTHQFTWGSNEQAYGWIMRFTGHDPAAPINATQVLGGDANPSPPSPAVTTTVANTMILRIGGFDDDDINVDDTGLAGHTDITMDESSSGNGTCSGGAGYKQQSAIGDSGTSTFSLTGWEQYRTVTIAIAPDAGG